MGFVALCEDVAVLPNGLTPRQRARLERAALAAQDFAKEPPQPSRRKPTFKIRRKTTPDTSET